MQMYQVGVRYPEHVYYQIGDNICVVSMYVYIISDMNGLCSPMATGHESYYYDVKIQEIVKMGRYCFKNCFLINFYNLCIYLVTS